MTAASPAKQPDFWQLLLAVVLLGVAVEITTQAAGKKAGMLMGLVLIIGFMLAQVSANGTLNNVAGFFAELKPKVGA